MRGISLWLESRRSDIATVTAPSDPIALKLCSESLLPVEFNFAADFRISPKLVTPESVSRRDHLRKNRSAFGFFAAKKLCIHESISRRTYVTKKERIVYFSQKGILTRNYGIGRAKFHGKLDFVSRN